MSIFKSLLKTDHLAFWLSIFVTITAILSFFICNGGTFPIPWDDESSFTLQAISWAESNTLFTNALNNERTIMWMNPAYMILTGSIYKIFGYSFALSRGISWIFYIASILIFALTLKKTVSFASIVVLMAIFILPSSLASGNIARMEVMVMFFAALILMALFHKRIWFAIAILISCALFHFNAVYLVLPIIGALGLEYKSVKSLKSFYPNHLDMIVLGISTILFVTYLMFILNNFDGFKNDMAYQFSRKFGRTPFYEMPRNIFYIGAIVGVTFLAFLKNKQYLTILGLMSLSFFLTYAVGQEMWYSIFCNLSFGLIGIVLLNLLPLKPIVQVTFAIAFILLNIAHAGLSFAGMRPKFFAEPYLDLPTRLEIESQVIKLKKGSRSNSQVTVSFVSRGVGMMFYPFLQKNNLQYRYKLPDQITANFASDICVYVTRYHDPEWLVGALGAPNSEMCKEGLILSKSNGDVRVFNLEGTDFVRKK